MTISMDKKYRTRDGRDVRLLCVDADMAQPVVGLAEGELKTWCNDGTWLNSTVECSCDLIEVHPRIKRDAWINVYAHEAGLELFHSEENAKKFASFERIACVKVSIDCEYGEGLSNA